jgi:hypothetical protein
MASENRAQAGIRYRPESGWRSGGEWFTGLNVAPVKQQPSRDEKFASNPKIDLLRIAIVAMFDVA